MASVVVERRQHRLDRGSDVKDRRALLGERLTDRRAGDDGG